MLATQAGLAAIAGILAVLTLTHEVAASQVYLIAFGLGIVTAVDNPTRQSFADEMVGPRQLSNAISINSSVFQLGGLIGPAISGALISAVGPGYSFAINALSYAAPLAALSRMRTSELHTMQPVNAQAGQLRGGLHYAVHHPDILWPTVLAGISGVFTLNLPVTIRDLRQIGLPLRPRRIRLLTQFLPSDRRRCAGLRPPVPHLPAHADRLRRRSGGDEMLSATALDGNLLLFLLPVAVTLLLLTATNSAVQTAAPDAIRSRLMDLCLLVFVGGAAFGGPLLRLSTSTSDRVPGCCSPVPCPRSRRP